MRTILDAIAACGILELLRAVFERRVPFPVTEKAEDYIVVQGLKDFGKHETKYDHSDNRANRILPY
jgi:hypothetical protein